ncbi:MAG TPA: FAD binding domain-containing protein [Candidatus Dormibacteraeota bacterium]|nr:FAD binding domain-containing protein [Candidatus Dormibacteraeota bacterium]
MEFFQPDTWTEALQVKAAHPEARPIAGGTDVMVEMNLDHGRPAAIVDLTRVRELTEWGTDGGVLRVGAGVTYTRLIDELGDRLPGLAIASRTVGSPQIRNRGTVGGNLGTASPAGDAHPPLLASDAEVELASTSGVRRVPVREFFTGPKRSAMRPDELIASFLVEPAKGGQQFSKVGTRNAMVIAVCSFAVAIDRERRTVGTGIGSAGPTPLRALDAEEFMRGVLDEENLWDRGTEVSESALRRFGELVAMASRPIDDVRGTAAYRRHALSVLARRTFTWAWAASPSMGRWREALEGR